MAKLIKKVTKLNKKTEDRLALVKGDALAPTPAAAMFEDAQEAALDGFKVKSRSPMLKPSDFPVGKILRGILVKLIPCVAGKNEDGTEKEGTLVEIKREGAALGVALPVTAVIKSALDITGEGKSASCPHLGKEVAIQKLEEKIPSKRGQSAHNFIVAIRE